MTQKHCPPELTQFIIKAKQRGFSEAEITAKLMAAGWAPAAITLALENQSPIPAVNLWREPTWPMAANSWAKFPSAKKKPLTSQVKVKPQLAAASPTAATANFPVVPTAPPLPLTQLPPAVRAKRQKLKQQVISRTREKHRPQGQKFQQRLKIRAAQTQQLIAVQEKAVLLALGLLGVIVLSLLWRIFVIK
jgi:hypothetical protein